MEAPPELATAVAAAETRLSEAMARQAAAEAKRSAKEAAGLHLVDTGDDTAMLDFDGSPIAPESISCSISPSFILFPVGYPIAL